MAKDSTARDEDDPLPLSELKGRVSEKTFQWLEETERSQTSTSSGRDDDDEEPTFFGFGQEEEEEKWTRVQEWCSSASSPDGFGGYVDSEEPSSITSNGDEVESAIRVQYILSSVSGGHGDDLWASSRHVANLLANQTSCRQLLSPLLEKNDIKKDGLNHDHPLEGCSFLELGAGGGVPSWTAQWCGARVVCTDQSIADRIRCLAECAERNGRSIVKQQQKSTGNARMQTYAAMSRACPYDWGTPIDEVVDLLNQQEAEPDGNDGNSNNSDPTISKRLFDVVVAADCVYMPELHQELMDSIRMLLDPNHGVALVPFALHGNTDDTRVWGIVQVAEQKGFQVENLGSLQLTPQADGMDAKRALVHMLRMTLH